MGIAEERGLQVQILKGLDTFFKVENTGIKCPASHMGDCTTCPGSPEPNKYICRIGMKLAADMKRAIELDMDILGPKEYRKREKT